MPSLAWEGSKDNPTKVYIFEVKQAHPEIQLGKKGNNTQMQENYIRDVIREMRISGKPKVVSWGDFLFNNNVIIEKHVIGMCKNCPDPLGGDNNFNQVIHTQIDDTW